MNEADWIKYFRIVSAMKAGRKISKDDRDFFTSAHSEADPKVFDSINEKVKAGTPLEDADYDALFNETRKMLTSPENKEKVLGLAQKVEQGKISQNVRMGLNLALAGTDIATSLQQIKKGNQITQNARRPVRPPVLQRDQLLANALADAGNNRNDVTRALLPAQQGINDAYQADLANARTAAGGQAGAYGAYAQSAVNRRNQANLNLVPLGDQVRRENQRRYDSLVGQHVQEGEAINASQGRFYPEDLYQYNLNQQMGAGLGQTGRYNLRTSLTGLAQQLPGAIGNLATNAKYNDIYNRMIAQGYGTDNAKIAADAHGDVQNHWDGTNTMYKTWEDSQY